MIRKLIRDRIIKGAKKIILLIPEQNSFESERGLLGFLGEYQFKFVSVLSFERLCHFVGEQLGRPEQETLSRGQRNALINIAVKNIEKNLILYSGASSSLETVKMISETIKNIKNSGFNQVILRELAKDFKNETLKSKIYDISFIISEYEKLICQKFSDPLDNFTVLLNLLKNNNFFSDFYVFIDEFISFSEIQIKILEIIIKSTNVWISLNCDRDFNNLKLTERDYIVKKTAKILNFIAKNNKLDIKDPIILNKNHRFVSPELKIIEENLFKINKKNSNLSQNINIYIANSIYEERDFIARNIRKLIIEEGFKYSDFTVITGNIKTYGSILENVFKNYDIPYFYDYPEPILHKNLMILVFSALDCISENFKSNDIFRYLKSGLTKFNCEEISVIENYCLFWEISGDKWRFDFKNKIKESDDLEKINNLRKEIINPLFKLKKEINKNGVSKALYNFLCQINIPENIKILHKKFIESGNLKLAEEQIRLWDILIKALDETHGILSDLEFSLEKFSECLKMTVQSADISFIPQCSDEVIISDISRSYFRESKVVFIAGVSEGDFPQNFSQKNIFNNFEYKTLRESGIDIGDNSEEFRARGVFLSYAAVSSASHKLFISRYETENKIPGEIIKEIKSILPNAKIQNTSDLLPEDFLWAKKPAIEYLALISGKNEQLESVLKKYFEEKSDFLNLTPIERSQEQFDNKRIFSFKEDSSAFGIFSKNIVLSASQIEKFYSCRFSYFCRYVMNAKERKPIHFGKLEYGTLIHFLFEKILKKEIKKENFELEFEINSLTNEYAERNFGGLKEKSARFKFLLSRHGVPMRILIRAIEKSFEKSEFKPIAHELQISNKKGALTPMIIKLDDGSKVLIEGKIDRLDMLKTKKNKFIRIIDYKTNSKKFDIDEAKSGVSSQMLIYMAALRQNAVKIYGSFIPAGFFYFSAVRPHESTPSSDRISAKIINKLNMSGIACEKFEIVSALDQEGIFKQKKRGKTNILISSEEMDSLLNYAEILIVNMASELKKGSFFSNFSEKKTCDYCEFYSICSRLKRL
ncbi:MAG: PD-(D/E)XK nuclease family protein [Oscillospiraceae bacterium]|jgi:ATP-dependent helicase/nuclease subunit B|nr:PD-(D/E)XK nuclease family protein [Oscillospiraceae bacterium]